jgi:hypothetical protein
MIEENDTGNSPMITSPSSSSQIASSRTTRKASIKGSSRCGGDTTFKRTTRVKILSVDRQDNNMEKLMKAVGHKRTKNQDRSQKFKVNFLVNNFRKLRFANPNDSEFMQAFRIVLNELKALNAQVNLNRAAYSDEFKSSIKILCSDQGISILKAAAESAGLLIKPITQPNREVALEEEVKSLKHTLSLYVNLANLPPLSLPLLSSLIDEDASFTTEDTGMPLPQPSPSIDPELLSLDFFASLEVDA